MEAKYYLYSNTNKNSQSEKLVDIESLKSYNVLPSRLIGDFTIWFEGFIIGYLFASFNDFKKHCSENGF